MAGEDAGDTVQSSSDAQSKSPDDGESTTLGDAGGAVADPKGQGAGEEMTDARRDEPSPEPGPDAANRGAQRQAEQADTAAGDDGSEQNRQAANRPGDELAAGRKPGRDDLLGDAPEAGAEQGRQQGRHPLAGGVGETTQAIEQMLRRVDDDPGGLLRQRFLLQHLHRNGQLR
jgi:Ca-activated chloride channel family protein